MQALIPLAVEPELESYSLKILYMVKQTSSDLKKG